MIRLLDLALLFIIVFLFYNCNKPEQPEQTNAVPESLNSNPFKKEGSRQIHLDFHTSEHLTEIGGKFDKDQFQEALKIGNVNSINVFAKGHHGWSYYPTEIGSMHPNLKFDLLKAQIEACHEIGISVQAYFAVGWSQKDALDHPEWAIRDEEGYMITYPGQRVIDVTPENPSDELPYTYWTLLSPERAYLDLILKQTEELVSNYDLDGIWYDIIPVNDMNYNEESKRDMIENGINLPDKVKVNDHHVEKMKIFFESANRVVKTHLPDASIFYNWSTALNFSNVHDYKLYKYNTKMDLEDLPTTWDGYDLFPMRAKYYANIGEDIVAMSGKFHTAWGEFGGFKHKDAILYEAASMISFGARANFGDQLHPSGIMEIETYKNIGYAYDYFEKIEEYGLNSRDVATVGVWLSMSKHHDEGTVKMLLENQVDFLIANNLDDISVLETIIINGGNDLSSGDIKKLAGFVSQDGKLLVMGQGLLDRANQKFQIEIGVDYVGTANYDVDFTLVSEKIAENLPVSPYLNYEPAVRVSVNEGTEILASIREPYFSRTLENYTSHRNTPYRLENAAHPAVTKNGNFVFIAHDLGKLYYENGARVHKDVFINSLSLVNEKPLIQVDMPSAGRINLLHQPQHQRYVAHFLYAPALQRGIAQVIEDLVPLYNIPVKLNLPENVVKVYTIPGFHELDFKLKNKTASVIIPEVQCHQAVVFEYE